MFYNFEHWLVEIMGNNANRFDSGQGQMFLSSPKDPNQLWDPTSLLFDVNRMSFFPL